MLGCAESEHPKLTNVKLFSKNYNQFDHDTSTLRTQTDGQLAVAIPRDATRAICYRLSVCHSGESDKNG